ncbi:MAG: methyltransferase domain-containing protein [Deltaproteobacteria bacterium]|nr:methyltransferase domain-containing protein [Deltaproteobacteria bacterium]
MSLLHRVAEQFRQPEGFFGSLLCRFMEHGNRPANDWTLECLALKPTDQVLEVGYGPGAAIEPALRAVPRGRVVGIDFSQTMYRRASRRHAAAIAAGRVALLHGELAALPHPPGSFDKVFAVNVLYFVPDPEAWLRALHGLTRPGGRVALFIRAEQELRRMPFTSTGLFRIYRPDEAVQLARRAGFARGWFESRALRGGPGHVVLAER